MPASQSSSFVSVSGVRAVGRLHARSRRAGGCACALGGRAGIQHLKGGLDVCGGDGSHVFERHVRPSTRINREREGGGGGLRGDIIPRGKERGALLRNTRTQNVTLLVGRGR